MSIRPDTKKILADSLVHLLKEKDFESIKVQDITENCGASRTTFYKHFHDKYELISWFYKENADSILLSADDPYEGMESLCQWVIDKKKFFHNVSSYRGQNALLDYVIKYAVDMYADRIKESVREEEYDDMLFALNQYMAGGVYVFFQWIDNHFDIPPKVLSRRLIDNMPEFLKDPIMNQP